MHSLILDTNIYGELVIDTELEIVKGGISEKKSLILFGSKIIRKELRATPKEIKVGGSNLRIDMLSLYDLLTRERVLEVAAEAEELADNYLKAYHEFGGAKGSKEMRNDFLIVASASLRNMDIVVSNDEASMKSENSLKAYGLVNSIRKLRNPKFINYNGFKELLR